MVNEWKKPLVRGRDDHRAGEIERMTHSAGGPRAIQHVPNDLLPQRFFHEH